MKPSRFILMLVVLALAALACSQPTSAPTVVVETRVVIETVLVVETVVVATPVTPVAIVSLPTDFGRMPEGTLVTFGSIATSWPTSTLTPSHTATYNPNDYWTRGTPTPFVACPGALPSRLWAGGYAYVIPEPPTANIVRSGAGRSNREIGSINPGWAMEVLEGPTCADNLVWWKVRSFADDLTGWTAEQDGLIYWLAPCPPETECGMPMDGY